MKPEEILNTESRADFSASILKEDSQVNHNPLLINDSRFLTANYQCFNIKYSDFHTICQNPDNEFTHLRIFQSIALKEDIIQHPGS